MTGTFTTIDLSSLPPPAVLEALDYEAIRAAIVADYRTRYPAFTAELESEPVIKLIEVMAYRELLLRARVNDAAKAGLVASAIGADLDNLAAFFGVVRLAGETDDRLRLRVVAAPEAYSSAGPIGAYQFHALSVSTNIKDVSVVSPKPGYVTVTIQSKDAGGGIASATLLAAVRERLNSDTVRPLTDVVDVRSVSLVAYSVDADLWLYPGPDAETVRAAAVAAVNAYAAEQHVIGRDITMSGLYAALHRAGVQRAEIREPLADKIVSPLQTAYCESVKVRVVGRAE